MTLRYSIRLMIVPVFLSVTALAPGMAMADMSMHFDYSQLKLDYTPSGQPGNVVGTLIVSLSPLSNLTVIEKDLGVDVDSTRILDYQSMSLAFSADVVKIGQNVYQISGSFSGTDTDLSNYSHAAGFAGDYVGYTDYGPVLGGYFVFGGALHDLATMDAILMNRQSGGNDWVFTGDSAGDVSIPDGDGNANTVTLQSGVEDYDLGNIFAFELGVDSVLDVDAFFEAERHYTGAEMKLDVVPVPTPGAALLAMIGLGLVGRIKRSFA